ncbi:MAG: FG-GAP repeat domain-containing protein [Candidatus Glassbacteria bacterium]
MRSCLGDIDADGEVEIVVGTIHQKVYAWDRFGNDKPNWPWEATSSWDVFGVVLADVVGDSALEVIANFGWPDSINIYVLDGVTAAPLPGWPQPEGMSVRGYQSVVVSDIDYDGEKEIVMAGYDACPDFQCSGYVLGYNPDGTMVPGFPISIGYEGAAYAPCIVDLDQDDDLEI